METAPALSIAPVLKEIDDRCPSPTERTLMIKRREPGNCPCSGVTTSGDTGGAAINGAMTMEGLKSAVASKAYSEVK
jgi:hypothetical protein